MDESTKLMLLALQLPYFRFFLVVNNFRQVAPS